MVIRMKHIKIAAGMAEGFDFGKVKERMKEALDAGCDYCHSDAADMYEVKNLQLIGGHNIMYYVRQITDKPIECHFYTQECDLLFIEKIAYAGCNLLILPAERFIGTQLVSIIDWCREKNMKTGLTIGSYTPLSLVEEAIYDIDRLHVETQGAGNHFRESSLDLVRRARKLIDEKNPSCELSVGGKVCPENMEQVVACNPDVVVVSSAIFKDADGIGAGVRKCRTAVNEAVKKFNLQ